MISQIRGLASAVLLVCLASCGRSNVIISDYSSVMAYITPVYARQVYYMDSRYNKHTELTVMAVYPDGGVEIVPIERVSVFYDGTRIDDIAYTFEMLGGFILTIHYEGMSASYTVTVLDPSATAAPDPDAPPINGGDDGGGFGIIIHGP